jgi:hypothetical protein
LKIFLLEFHLLTNVISTQEERRLGVLIFDVFFKIREEIICFGVILYEMSVGCEPVEETSFDHLKIDKTIISILNSIFSTDPVTVEDLLNLEFFASNEVEEKQKLVIRDTGMISLFFKIKTDLDDKRKKEKPEQGPSFKRTSSIKVGVLTKSEEIVSDLKSKEKIIGNVKVAVNDLTNKRYSVNSVELEEEEESSSVESTNSHSTMPRIKSIDKVEKEITKRRLSTSVKRLINSTSSSSIRHSTELTETFTEKQDALLNLKNLLDNGFIDSEEYNLRKEQIEDATNDEHTEKSFEESPIRGKTNLQEKVEEDEFDVKVEAFGDSDLEEEEEPKLDVKIVNNDIAKELSDEEDGVIVEVFE